MEHITTAYGMDGIFKVPENDYLNVKVAQVMDESATNKVLSLDPTELFHKLEQIHSKRSKL